MKTTQDTVDQLRPTPRRLDPEWSRATLDTILASGPATTRTSHRRPRAALIGAVAALPLTAGVGYAAVSNDLVPQAFTEAFFNWGVGNPDEGIRGADPGTARRLATAPGPDGTVFTVMGTAGDGEYGCRTAVIETRASAQQPQPDTFQAITGHWCSSEPSSPHFAVDGVEFVGDTAGYVVSAGDAVRARVRTDTGGEHPAVLVNGDFWGWFPKAAERATLTGYAADGSVVGRIRLTK